MCQVSEAAAGELAFLSNNLFSFFFAHLVLFEINTIFSFHNTLSEKASTGCWLH
jgi:hypothetical protein